MSSTKNLPKYKHESQLVKNQFSTSGWEKEENLPLDQRTGEELFLKRLFGDSGGVNSTFKTNLYKIPEFLEFQYQEFLGYNPRVDPNLYLDRLESIALTYNQYDIRIQMAIDKIRSMVENWVINKRIELGLIRKGSLFPQLSIDNTSQEYSKKINIVSTCIDELHNILLDYFFSFRIKCVRGR